MTGYGDTNPTPDARGGDVVERAKAALEGVTPGPWAWSFPEDRGSDELISETAITAYYDGRADREGRTGYPTRVLSGTWHNDDTAGIGVSDVDAAFIAATVGLVPELVAEIEQARSDISNLQRLLRNPETVALLDAAEQRIDEARVLHIEDGAP